MKRIEDFVMTVGLEVHAELKTKTKIFCSCPTDFGAPPNTQICPICMGLPGAMPSLNKKAVEYAVKAGLALGCEISERFGIDRKNYFYPDLPKGYQISEYDRPICRNGYVDIVADGIETRIGIERIHIEEDAGKLLHVDGNTLIDHNRCGRPLIEIVSSPQLHSPEAVRAYLKKLRSILICIGVSDCKMNEGSFRCDVNISVSRENQEKMGERTEIKNLNSFAFAQKAVEYEYERQCEILKKGGSIARETLRYDTASKKCVVMRRKENAVDYRFMPEPDLHDVILHRDETEKIRATIPKLPDQRSKEYTEKFGLSLYDSSLLASETALSEFFEEAAEYTEHKKLLANIILSEILRLSTGEDFSCPIPPNHVGELAQILGEEKINGSTAKKLISAMWKDRRGTSPVEIVEEEGAWQINSEDELLPIVRAAVEQSAKAAEDYKKGKSSAIGAVIGKAMALSKGRANPEIVNSLVRSVLEKD